MSHAKEIRQKKELQAKLQLASSKTSSLVSSWLKPLNQESLKDSSNIIDDPSKDAFFNLPIIGGSSGLSLAGMNTSLNPNGNNDQINTIGDYVKTGKSLTSLSNKKKGIDQNGKPIIAIQSKALQALQSKIRKSNIQKQRKAGPIIRNQNQNQRGKDLIKNGNNDSDSDEEVVQKSAPKKSFGLLIDSKIKKKK